jgi:mycothione reductase
MVQAFRAPVKTPIAGVVRPGRPPPMGPLRLRVDGESTGTMRGEKGQYIMDSAYGNERAVRRIIASMVFRSGSSNKGRRTGAKTYDIVVVGSGSGGAIVQKALGGGAKVALVDKGPAGGTCLNSGCIPSKMLIAAADRVMDIEEAGRFGIAAKVERIDFASLVGGVRDHVAKERDRIAAELARLTGLDYYPARGEFVDGDTIDAGGTLIRGETVFLASGSRPLIPDIPGLEEAGYLTNESLLALDTAPQSLAIIGGGYIAAEYGHFFSAMGTEVTIVQRGDRLVPREEPEISKVLEEALGARMKILTRTAVVEAGRTRDGCFVAGQPAGGGERVKIEAERILVAAGRRSNADLLRVDRAGIKTDARGFIEVDKYLETSRPRVWAIGDANGKAMFTHAANAQAEAVWHNAMHEKTSPMDHGIVPHAVFSRPQIASIGLTEARARERHDVLVGTARYDQTAKGLALRERQGFATAIVERTTFRLLGFHIVGPGASVLIQEVSNAMANGEAVDSIIRGYHIHPALSELVTWTLGALE